MYSKILRKCLLIFSMVIFCGCAHALTFNTYNGGYSGTKTIYNPMTNTRTTVQVRQTILPGTGTGLNPTSISTRAHNITPSVQYTNVPTQGYSHYIHTPTVQVYNATPPQYGVVINNNNGNITRYPVNNIPYYGNRYYVNTVQVPVVTKTTTTTTGNGTYTYSEDYTPFSRNIYSNGNRFLSW